MARTLSWCGGANVDTEGIVIGEIIVVGSTNGLGVALCFSGIGWGRSGLDIANGSGLMPNKAVGGGFMAGCSEPTNSSSSSLTAVRFRTLECEASMTVSDMLVLRFSFTELLSSVLRLSIRAREWSSGGRVGGGRVSGLLGSEVTIIVDPPDRHPAILGSEVVDPVSLGRHPLGRPEERWPCGTGWAVSWQTAVGRNLYGERGGSGGGGGMENSRGDKNKRSIMQ